MIAPSDSAGVSRTRVTGITLALMALFLIALLPILTSTARYHVDEQYYTDAAIRMTQTGDYLTPTFGDGSLRFNKPILTYWAVVAGYKLFGIGYFATRFLFALSGAVLIWLTLQLSRALFRDETAAFLTVVLIFSNNELFTASLRATPDVLLCLFATASFLAFARILFGGERRFRWRLVAYAAAGLAFATKGLLAIPIVVWPLALGWIRRRRGHEVGRLADPASVLAGLLLAGGWFAAVLAVHGRTAIEGFYMDQVGIRTGAPAVQILSNALTYFLVLLRDFLPWTLLILAALPVAGPRLARFLRGYRWQAALILGFTVILFAIFSSANLLKTRYFFPAFPLLAALLGGVLAVSLREPRLIAALERLDRALLGAALAAAGLVMALGLQLDARFLAAGAALFLSGVALFAAARRMPPVIRPLAVGLFIFASVWAYDMFARPVFSISPAPALVTALGEVPAGTEIRGVGITPKYLSQMRVLSGGRLLPVPQPVLPPGSLRPRPVLIVGEAQRDSLDRSLYRIAPGGFDYLNPETGDILGTLTGQDPDALFDRLRRRFFVAIPHAGDSTARGGPGIVTSTVSPAALSLMLPSTAVTQ